MFKSKRAKATAISKKTKEIVYVRDKCRCVYCGSPYGLPEAHIVSRQRGGLGTEKNIVTLCRPCHFKFDSGTNKERIDMMKFIKEYIYGIYGKFDDNEVIYEKEWKKNVRKNLENRANE